MRANRKTDTRPERAIRSELHARGARFRKHYRIGGGRQAVVVDIAFTKKRVAVFIDGCFWHSCPAHGTSPKSNVTYWKPKLEMNRARDRAVDERLVAIGWRVLRVWEHEEPGEAAARITAAVTSRA